VRHSFQVDLRGVVDLLSAHLYSSPDVYVRELLQNAVDALTARGAPPVRGSVVVECHAGSGPPVLSVEDDGVGLTVDEVHELLATIGSSSKRDTLLEPRADYLGRFGIGLLSCFLVSDEIRVVTRSARGGPGVSWQGRSDGTYELRELADGEGRTTPGTTVWLTARPGLEDRLLPDTVRALVLRYAGLLETPIVLRTATGEEVLAGRPLPWVGQDRDALLAWGEDALGHRFLDAVPLDLPAAGCCRTGPSSCAPWSTPARCSRSRRARGCTRTSPCRRSARASATRCAAGSPTSPPTTRDGCRPWCGCTRWP
jgi:molecular chaperone HtpG